MEQVARMNLPIVGRVQHGEKQIVDNKTKVKELGYFIAKIRNDNMNFLLNKFNEKYQAAVQALFERISTLQKGDILIISGSVPLSLPQDFYERIMDLLKGRGIDTVVDATGEALLKTLRYEPFLIKPNLQELEELAERRLFTREEIIAQGKRLQEMGAKNVLISLAAEGAILLTAEGEILFGEAPRGKLVNAVGAGDSMVGGFVAGWVKTGNYREALQWGVAAGSASAFCETLATGEEIRRLYDETINIIREEC